MTAVPGDTLQLQIERGEVWFTQVNINMQPNKLYDHLLEIDANPASLMIAVGTLSDSTFSLYEGPTGAKNTGVADTLLNMNFSSSNTTNIYSEYQVIPVTDGSYKTGEVYVQGVERIASPFSTETGVILEANTDYLIRVDSSNTVTNTFQFALFLREI